MNELFKTLDDQKFQSCSFDEMNVGDIVKITTFTNSQKYFFKGGYEDLNMTKTGILIEKNIEKHDLSKMLKYEQDTGLFSNEYLFRNPGTSGGYYFERYIK